ncbi:hypothetical protein [Aeromonas salmonicida]|nr:hypothetical protein [Aeromonas salmonicida]
MKQITGTGSGCPGAAGIRPLAAGRRSPAPARVVQEQQRSGSWPPW